MRKNCLLKGFFVLTMVLSLFCEAACTNKINHLIEQEAEEEVVDKDTVEIKAYPIGINLGDNVDFMKDVEAVLDSQHYQVHLDTSNVNMRVPGNYPVIYTAYSKDSVMSKKVVNLRIADPNKRIIYLTFDDGPSPNTLKILKILKENNVHATFFVTGQDPSCFSYIKQAYEEGNAIAAHTYSHNFSIYTNFDTYFKDLEKIQGVIEKYTGHRTKIIRFPGGSSNTVFRKHSKDPEFMLKLTKEVILRGYQYVDWNADSKDAETVYPNPQNLINAACRTYSKELCLLMHDTHAKTATVEALPTIIQFFKDNGYEFRTLTSTSYVCHHGIRARGAGKSSSKRTQAVVPVTQNATTVPAATHTTPVAEPAEVKSEPAHTSESSHSDAEAN